MDITIDSEAVTSYFIPQNVVDKTIFYSDTPLGNLIRPFLINLGVDDHQLAETLITIRKFYNESESS